MHFGLYVHLPFCAQRCSYCTFVSTTDAAVANAAVRASMAEVRRFRSGRQLRTLYLGGGTPSLVPLPLLEELFRSVRVVFSLGPGAEVTLEANPEDVTLASLLAWRTLGVTRLSLGVQTLDDEVLRLLQRRHDGATARRAVADARAAGFSVSADLMLGLPGQSVAKVEEETKALVALGPQHVSVYLLETDKPHPLGELSRRCPGAFPEEEEVARCYLVVARVLRRAGFCHYEISNFARPGFHARHNLRTWRQKPLLAVGVAAQGHCGRVRWGNLDDPRAYAAALAQGESPRAWRRVLSPDEWEREAAMLGLRLAVGVEWELVERLAGRLPAFARRLDDFFHLGLARKVGERLRLTTRGWVVSSELLQALW